MGPGGRIPPRHPPFRCRRGDARGGARVRILVTGASSFVGAHFCTLAAARGHYVVGLWNRTPLLIDGITSVPGDVTACLPAKVDVVVPLATKVMAADPREQNRRMLDAVLGWGLPVVYASS